MTNNTLDFLDKLDFALAGATGYAVALGNPIHALVFITCSILIAVVKHRVTKKNNCEE